MEFRPAKTLKFWPKTEARPEALGALDELNSLLGLVRSKSNDPSLRDIVLRIQNHLFAAGAEVAEPPGRESKPRIESAAIERLEKIQREIENALDLPDRFVIYGGTEISALLDLARAVARRAERAVLRAFEQEQVTRSNLPVYLNRLSDLLYILAREEDRKAGIQLAHPDYRM